MNNIAVDKSLALILIVPRSKLAIGSTKYILTTRVTSTVSKVGKLVIQYTFLLSKALLTSEIIICKPIALDIVAIM